MAELRPYDNGQNVLVRFHKVSAETAKAFQVDFSDESDSASAWMPKSQIAHIDREAGEVWIPLWLAEKKDLDYE